MSRALASALVVLLAGAAAPVASPSCDGYTVVRGDTLYRIARRCHASVAGIAQASGIRDPDLIFVGQRLVMPGRRAHAEPPAPQADRGGHTFYRMARGDTLYSLARWSRTSLPALLTVNPGIDPRHIEIGEAVRLPRGAVRPEPARTRERGAPAPAAAPPPPPGEARPPAPPRGDRPEETRREPEVEAM